MTLSGGLCSCLKAKGQSHDSPVMCYSGDVRTARWLGAWKRLMLSFGDVFNYSSGLYNLKAICFHGRAHLFILF